MLTWLYTLKKLRFLEKCNPLFPMYVFLILQEEKHINLLASFGEKTKKISSNFKISITIYVYY